MAEICAELTIPKSNFETTVGFAAESFAAQTGEAVSKHDSVTKRKRRPKSDKRVDYTARTMAVLKQHSEAEKLSESQRALPKGA